MRFMHPPGFQSFQGYSTAVIGISSGREGNGKGTSVGGTSGADSAAMLRKYAMHERQPQTRASRLGRKEGNKHPFEVFFWDSYAVVGKGELDDPAFLPG